MIYRRWNYETNIKGGRLHIACNTLNGDSYIKKFVLNFDKNTCFVCAWKLFFFVSSTVIESSWNVMAHEQKPDFVFRRNGRVHLNWRGASVQSTTGSRGVHISGSNAGYTMFRCSVKGTGYPLHSSVSPSLPLPCVTVFHHISTGLYIQTGFIKFIWLSNHQYCHIIVFIPCCMFKVPSHL